MNKQAELDKISKEIENCDECKVGKHGKAVPGEGNVNADVFFVGEAPGRNEAETGRPFIGRSGKLLRKMIADVGLTEEEVFITSPVKYLPDYITPTPQDIAHGKTHFDRQVEIVDPKIIVLLGRVASLAVLNKKISVVLEHGKIIEDNGRKYFITVHPSAALRFKKMKATLEEDFKKLKKLVS
jgi:DNA polymerase